MKHLIFAIGIILCIAMPSQKISLDASGSQIDSTWVQKF